jgi:hypothetical protein
MRLVELSLASRLNMKEHLKSKILINKFNRHGYMMNAEGRLVKQNEAEMNYMLFSKDGKEFPFKLSDKVSKKELESLGNFI